MISNHFDSNIVAQPYKLYIYSFQTPQTQQWCQGSSPQYSALSLRFLFQTFFGGKITSKAFLETILPQKPCDIFTRLWAILVVRSIWLSSIFSKIGLQIWNHIWSIGPPNPYELQQSWEWTFLKVYSYVNMKWASKQFFTFGLFH